MASITEMTIVREFYEALQRGEFERWDGIIYQNVLTNRPTGSDNTGLETLNVGAGAFAARDLPIYLGQRNWPMPTT
jgi:hypothetical protein